MRHLIFAEANQYPVALLIKGSGFQRDALLGNYVVPLTQRGLSPDQVIGFTLKYNEQGKAPVKYIKEYLDNLLPALDGLGTKYLFVADANYFKTLTGQTKAEPHYGYTLPCKLKGFEHMSVVLTLNHQALIYNPDLQAKLDLSLTALASSVQGTYRKLGEGIIHGAEYPEGEQAIATFLDSLHQYPELTCDIEAFSLRFDRAGVGTVAFAWDQHHGGAFAVDYQPTILDDGSFHPDCPLESSPSHHGFQKLNQPVRYLLRRFFETYQGKLTWHNSTYDLKVLIYSLWMTDPLDRHGLLQGLEVMTRLFDDTKIIAYLATNSTAGNVLGLKALAHEFAGNYAQDEITDIRKIPLPKLLEYNLVDCLATWFVKNKLYPVMVADRQEHLYHSLMVPSLKVIIQMELVGMPMMVDKIAKARAVLEAEVAECEALILGSPVVKLLNLLVQEKAWNKDFEDRRSKAKNPGKIFPKPRSAFDNVALNPNSGPQLQVLLYEQMGLPVIDYTDTKQPATGADTLEKLIHHTTCPEYQEILQALIRLGKAQKILSAFIPAFEEGLVKADGRIYLHGGFNLGGTVSGRLSSSKPNMQNLPANSKFGKLIKECFGAAAGWLFCGADFASLEDRINALLTKDPNKLKVYTDGYDGHALRAFAYFGDEMPGIDDSVASINSVAEKASPFYYLRQDSKSPTFALTYQGTWRTMVTNLGWPEAKAKKVEDNYKKLYQVSIQWVQDKISQAAKDGYAEVAFGLRIRTPLLAQTFLGTQSTPREAEAEARTLGNAISGQSYGLLNNRAVNAFMERVWASEFRYDILPCAQIHDAAYFLVSDRPEAVAYLNQWLTHEMGWQELPEIQHDQVKLGAELDLYWPDWAHPVTLPNSATEYDIRALCQAHAHKLAA